MSVSLRSLLTSLRRRLAARHRVSLSARRRVVEPLEQRSLLANCSFAGGILTVSGTDDENVTLNASSGLVQVNGSTNCGGSTVNASSVDWINVNGGADGVALDLSGVTSTDYSDVGTVSLTGGSGNDTITGSAFGDIIDGSSGANSISGGTGNDTISAISGSDNTINGGNGNDSITTGGGNDSISGGADNDTILSSLGNDTLTGDGGNDTYRFSGTGTGSDTVNEASGGGTDALEFSFGTACSINLSSNSGIVQPLFCKLRLGVGSGYGVVLGR